MSRASQARTLGDSASVSRGTSGPREDVGQHRGPQTTPGRAEPRLLVRRVHQGTELPGRVVTGQASGGSPAGLNQCR